MAQSFTRSYMVQNIATSPNGQLQVTLFESDGPTDINGAPMGASTVTFLMSVEEAHEYFPGDMVSITLGPIAGAPAPA